MRFAEAWNRGDPESDTGFQPVNPIRPRHRAQAGSLCHVLAAHRFSPGSGGLSVRDGQLVLPDGVRYRLLILPEDPAMTPVMAKRISARSRMQ